MQKISKMVDKFYLGKKGYILEDQAGTVRPVAPIRGEQLGRT